MALQVNETTPVWYRMPLQPQGSFGSIVPPQSALPLSDTSVIERLTRLRGRQLTMVEQLSRAVSEELRRRGEMVPFPVSIESVRLHGEVRSVHGDLQGQVTGVPGRLELEVPDLHIMVGGPDFTTLQEELFEELEVLYEQFVQAPVAELTPSGVALRNKLRTLLEG
jgi:hypothetical protein